MEMFLSAILHLVFAPITPANAPLLPSSISDDRSEGFPRTRITKSSCACDCGRGPVSVGAFFFLFFIFFILIFLSPRIVP